MISRHDFDALAAALASVRPQDDKSYLDGGNIYQQWRLDVEAVASVLAKSSPRFKRERWLESVVGEKQ